MYRLSAYLDVQVECIPGCTGWVHTWMYRLSAYLDVQVECIPGCTGWVHTWMYRLSAYLDVQVDKPCQRVLVHGLNVGHVSDTEEEDGGVYSYRFVAIPCIINLLLSGWSYFLQDKEKTAHSEVMEVQWIVWYNSWSEGSDHELYQSTHKSKQAHTDP